MQPVIDTVSKLTPSPPSGGSGVPDKPCFDLSKLDEAQAKADKLKATLLEIQALSNNIAKTLADQIAQLIIHSFAQALQCSDIHSFAQALQCSDIHSFAQALQCSDYQQGRKN